MVRTGARAAVLEQLLIAGGLDPAPAPPRPLLDDLDHSLKAEVMDLYRQFGGQGEPRLRPGTWDLAFEGNLVVELDEELHFNRYRRMTLSASWSTHLPWTADYQRFCERRESDCLSAGSWGKRWTNPSCERMFGPAGPPGKLDGDGAPRWKQRALYDCLKDTIVPRNIGVSLARVSVFDGVGKTTVAHVVEGRARATPQEIVELVEARSA